MTKFREIADKLGLPIGKEFKFDDNTTDFIFKINDEGSVLFYHEVKDEWVKSYHSLEDVYVKGYTLIDWVKPKRQEIGLPDSEYFKGIYNMLKEYKEDLEEELVKTQSVFEIQENKDTMNIVKMLINETERRLLNK